MNKNKLTNEINNLILKLLLIKLEEEYNSKTFTKNDEILLRLKLNPPPPINF